MWQPWPLAFSAETARPGVCNGGPPALVASRGQMAEFLVNIQSHQRVKTSFEDFHTHAVNYIGMLYCAGLLSHVPLLYGISESIYYVHVYFHLYSVHTRTHIHT